MTSPVEEDQLQGLTRHWPGLIAIVRDAEARARSAEAALLAERERLRGALEKAERDLFTAHDWIAEDARDTARIRAVAEFHRAARQALEGN